MPSGHAAGKREVVEILTLAGALKDLMTANVIKVV